jgi:hypothetical protein
MYMQAGRSGQGRHLPVPEEQERGQRCDAEALRKVWLIRNIYYRMDYLL